jgi:hypothetical protein
MLEAEEGAPRARPPTHTERLMVLAGEYVAGGAAPKGRAELADHLRRLVLLATHRLSEELDTCDLHAVVRFPPAAPVHYLELELWQRRVLFAQGPTVAWRLHVRLAPGLAAPTAEGAYLQAWTKSRATDGVLLQHSRLPAALAAAAPVRPPGLLGLGARLALALGRQLADWAWGSEALPEDEELGPVRGRWEPQLYRWLFHHLPHQLIVLVEQGNADGDALLHDALEAEAVAQLAESQAASYTYAPPYSVPLAGAGAAGDGRTRLSLSRPLEAEEREEDSAYTDDSDDQPLPAARRGRGRVRTRVLSDFLK